MTRQFYIPYKFLFLTLSCLLFQGCVEPYEFESQDFDNLMVVQASLTDELKIQEIFLSNTFRLDENQPLPLTGAQVSVHSEDLQLQHFFTETSPGVYRSQDAFAIRPEISYVLTIENDGRTYTSDPVKMMPGDEIDTLLAKRIELQGKTGIALMAGSSDAETASRFYRYEYEETYKIVSPVIVYRNLFADPENFLDWWLEPNTRDEEVCFNTRNSQGLILSSNSGLTENTSRSVLVRFIDSTDPVLAQRYSILVKKYSLTPQAYNYYSVLKELSQSESLFSENQPGFLYGNIHSQDQSERVIGYFSLSSVTTKRIFFNYGAFYSFEDGPRPQFPRNCMISRPGLDFQTPVELILKGQSRFVSLSGEPIPGEPGDGPMRLIATECVDCTVYGTNQVPEFWEE